MINIIEINKTLNETPNIELFEKVLEFCNSYEFGLYESYITNRASEIFESDDDDFLEENFESKEISKFKEYLGLSRYILENHPDGELIKHIENCFYDTLGETYLNSKHTFYLAIFSSPQQIITNFYIDTAELDNDLLKVCSLNLDDKEEIFELDLNHTYDFSIDYEEIWNEYEERILRVFFIKDKEVYNIYLPLIYIYDFLNYINKRKDK